MKEHILIARVLKKMARKKTCFDVLRKPDDTGTSVIRLHRPLSKAWKKGCVKHNFQYFDMDSRRWRQEEVKTKKGSFDFRVWARGELCIHAGVYEVSGVCDDGPYPNCLGEPIVRLKWIDCPLLLAALEESR